VANTFVIHTVGPDGTKTEHYRKSVTTISRLAFVSERDAGDPEIYTQLPDGTGAKRLTTSPGVDAEPAWSFDGLKLAFVSYRSGIAQIYFVNADGTGLTQLTRIGTTAHADQHPSWSPDGRHLTFSRDSASIVVRSLTGNDIPSLGGLVTEESANFATGKHQDPAFSPDGSKIAFVLNGRVWVADWTLVSTSAHDIGGLVSLARYPAWSPDGTRLAFVSTRYDGNYELYTVNVDGTGIRRLTTFAGADLEPSWSPDGQQIVFASLRGTKYDLYSVNAADGSGLVQRTTNAANDYMPSWSRCTQ
jgi:TolB protein